MEIQNYRQVRGKEEVPGVVMRVVAGPDEGAPNFAMRVFEIKPQSSTPYHSHNWEHEVFVLSGRGIVRSTEGERELSVGDAILVTPNEYHCFANTGDDLLRLICVVPLIDGRLPSTPQRDKQDNPWH
ncbi:MAG: cupin domain-containing protein [Dehalococcoidia bacterium]|nr:cupin domain-containing protein [Dehalococcoidia bacterium]